MQLMRNDVVAEVSAARQLLNQHSVPTKLFVDVPS